MTLTPPLSSIKSVFCNRYATYNDDVAVELELKASTAVDDDADESFDLKNYDITYAPLPLTYQPVGGIVLTL